MESLKVAAKVLLGWWGGLGPLVAAYAVAICWLLVLARPLVDVSRAPLWLALLIVLGAWLLAYNLGKTTITLLRRFVGSQPPPS